MAVLAALYLANRNRVIVTPQIDSGRVTPPFIPSSVSPQFLPIDRLSPLNDFSLLSLVFEALHRHEVDGEALHLLPQMQHRIQLNRNDHVRLLQGRIAD